MSDAWSAEDQAIARALDASSDAQTPDADPRAVDEYRAVLGHLPVPEVSTAAELEDRIIAAALERRAATPPVTTPRALTTRDGARARRVRRVRIAALAAAVAAAIAVGVTLGIAKSQSPVPSGHVSLATVRRAEIDSLLRAPGSRAGVFGAIGKVVIARNGNGAVYDLGVDAPLAIGLVSSGGTTVIGPARPRGGGIGFVVDHPERVRSVTLIRQGSVIATAQLPTR